MVTPDLKFGLYTSRPVYYCTGRSDKGEIYLHKVQYEDDNDWGVWYFFGDIPLVGKVNGMDLLTVEFLP